MKLFTRYAALHTRGTTYGPPQYFVAQHLRGAVVSSRGLATSGEGGGRRAGDSKGRGQAQRRSQGQRQGAPRGQSRGQQQERRGPWAEGKQGQGRGRGGVRKQGQVGRRRRWIGVDRKEYASKFGMTPIALKEEIYNLQLKEPAKWTDQALAAKYHLPLSKVRAILQIRQHELEYQEQNPDADDSLDVLAREVFGEFTLQGKKKLFDERVRRSELADSDNFIVLHPSEPSLDKQRKQWEEKGKLNRTKIGFKQEDVTGTAFLEESEAGADPYSDEDDGILRKTDDGFVFIKA